MSVDKWETQGTAWIITRSGLRIDMIDLEANLERITITDIAHSLSRQSRFVGHFEPEHYSIAEHSVLVSRMVEHAAPRYFDSEFGQQYMNSPPWDKKIAQIALVGLMHDAVEYALGDMSSPQKSVTPEYKERERRLELVIDQRFKLDRKDWALIKSMDNYAYQVERRDLFTPSGYDEWAEPLPPLDSSFDLCPWNYDTWDGSPENCVASGWSPDQARARFIRRFADLDARRRAQ